MAVAAVWFQASQPYREPALRTVSGVGGTGFMHLEGVAVRRGLLEEAAFS